VFVNGELVLQGQNLHQAPHHHCVTGQETRSDEGCEQKEEMSRISKGSGFREGQVFQRGAHNGTHTKEEGLRAITS
jgi:hypothetical protein